MYRHVQSQARDVRRGRDARACFGWPALPPACNKTGLAGAFQLPITQCNVHNQTTEPRERGRSTKSSAPGVWQYTSQWAPGGTTPAPKKYLFSSGVARIYVCERDRPGWCAHRG